MNQIIKFISDDYLRAILLILSLLFVIYTNKRIIKEHRLSFLISNDKLDCSIDDMVKFISLMKKIRKRLYNYALIKKDIPPVFLCKELQDITSDYEFMIQKKILYYHLNNLPIGLKQNTYINKYFSSDYPLASMMWDYSKPLSEADYHNIILEKIKFVNHVIDYYEK